MTDRVKKLARELPRNDFIMGKAMRASGYSDSYSKNPHLLKRTKGYNRVMESVIDRITRLRDDTIKALEGKDPSQEEYKTLVVALAEYTKQIQLLSYQPTEITATTARQIPEAELEAKREELKKFINGEDNIGGEAISDSGAGENKQGAGTEETN